MPNPLLVGVDVHCKSNSTCCMDRSGHTLGTSHAFPNNRPGTELLAQELSATLAEGHYDSMELAAEATGYYWWHLFQCLAKEPCLEAWPVRLYPLNPRLPASFKKTYGDADKDDITDAFVIADRLRLGRDLPPPYELDEAHFGLRLLTRSRFRLAHELAREKSYFLAHLYLKASQYSQLQPFSDVFGVASRAVIEEFASLEEVAALPLAQLEEFIDLKSHRCLPQPHRNALRLKQVAQQSYVLPASLQGPLEWVLHQSLQRVGWLEGQRKRLDAAIVEQLAAIPHTLDTVPGLGSVFAAGIIAEVGDVERFGGDEAKVAQYAGLKWSRYQSGDFQAQDTRLSRRGNRYLRYYLCEGANTVRMQDAEYRAYYARKHAEVRTHQHRRALVLTARKLVRLVVRLLSTNQPYRPRRL